MQTQVRVNDLNVWALGVPVIGLGTDGEFNVWQYQTPAVDIDESQTNQEATRRRVFEF
jgi:hypothetical protein